MSEYIIRTDKPIECCAECPIRHSQGSAWCQYLMKWTPDKEEIERLPDCPLVELPPHGKLIDADLAEEVMREVGKIHTSLQQRSMIKVAINTLKSAPIILEASEE